MSPSQPRFRTDGSRHLHQLLCQRDAALHKILEVRDKQILLLQSIIHSANPGRGPFHSSPYLLVLPQVGTWIMPLVALGAFSSVIWVTKWAYIPKGSFQIRIGFVLDERKQQEKLFVTGNEQIAYGIRPQRQGANLATPEGLRRAPSLVLLTEQRCFWVQLADVHMVFPPKASRRLLTSDL